MITRASRRSGFALIMVVVVSVALLAIAIPFAVSMRHQEKGAHGGMDRAQARYAALAGRNHALAGVIRGHETAEETKGTGAPFNTPYSDTLEEFQVTWPGTVPPMTEVDGAGRLRGALLQDEQGKVNIRTAPQRVRDRIYAKVDERTQDMREFLTEWSGRPCAWNGAQTIRGIAPATALDGSPAVNLAIDDGAAFGEGARVRVTWNGIPEYGTVDTVNSQGQDITVKGLTDAVSQVGAIVEIEIRHPVNINTASRIVLASCLEGLGLRNKLSEDVVTSAEATALADLMAGHKFISYEDFNTWIWDQRTNAVISNFDATAIIINFSNPNARRLEGTGTLPFTLASDNFVTVAAQGVQDFPSKAFSALCDLRDVVEMAPAGTLRWRVKSQYDMDRMLRVPTGRFVVTWPACPQNLEVPSTDRNLPAWVTTRLGKDDRAQWKIVNHFDNTIAGISTAKGAYVQDASGILQITGSNVDIEAGAAELWIKTASTGFTIFDAGDEEWSNRLWFSYGMDSVQGTNVLKFCVKDSSLEHSFAEVVHPVTLTPDTWYHVGAFWKGTKYGHAMMTLDGLPVGKYGVWTETGQSHHTLLASAIDDQAQTITCTTSTSGFPSPGAIQIGQEVIEYASASGSSFTGCVRGARGTGGPIPVPPPNPMVPIGWPHQAGAGVTILGYTAKLMTATLTFTNPTVPTITWDKLTTGGGQTVGLIGDNTVAHVKNLPPSTGAVGLAAGQLFLDAVLASGAPDLRTQFPASGWLVLNPRTPISEVVQYTSCTANQFTGLTRGLFGTTDRDHADSVRIELFGFHVTTNANYLSPTVLAIDDEWFGPLIKEGADGWRGFVIQRAGATIALPLFRGNSNPNLWQTVAAVHASGANVFPTFAIEPDYSGALPLRPGDLDDITLVEQDPATREAHQIKHARWLPNLGIGSSPPQALIASLGAFARKDWVPDKKWVRALKFPSGELMGVNQAVMTFAGSSIATAPAGFNGLMDECRLTNGPKVLLFQMSTSIDATATTIPIVSVSGMDAEGGAILVGDELIGYAGVDSRSNTLINCTRGYLGSTAATHELGDRVFNMAFLAIASLTAPMGATDKAVPISPNGFPRDGYVYVGTELIGYTWMNGSGLSFPEGCDFRGAFGTVAAIHNQNELVYAFPYRYYDRFTANSDDNQTSWFGAVHRATGAKWGRILWDETLPNPSLDIQVRVRLNGEPRFNNVPTNKPYQVGKGGGIWLFTNPTGGALGGTKADAIDVRVDFVWLDDAYSKGEWKDCAQFHGLTVEYEQEPVIHYHEEK